MTPATIVIDLPMDLPSVANLREHWTNKHSRNRAHRAIAKSHVAARLRAIPGAKAAAVVVTLTRIAPRPLDDDNLSASFKGLRDGVADAFGVDDGASSTILAAHIQQATADSLTGLQLELLMLAGLREAAPKGIEFEWARVTGFAIVRTFRLLQGSEYQPRTAHDEGFSS